MGQFGRHFWGIAERSDDIIVVIRPGVTAKSLPKCIGLGGSCNIPDTITVRALALHRICTSERGMQRQFGNRWEPVGDVGDISLSLIGVKLWGLSLGP